MDDQREVDRDTLGELFTKNKIENSKAQLQNLFKVIDTDNDVMVNLEEFEAFLRDYDPKKQLSTNILTKSGGKKNKMLA